MTPAGCKFLGLVKADAYGHGAVPVAKKLEQLGCDMLAVACFAEGALLRQEGIAMPILCLGPTPAQLAQELVKLDIRQMVEDLPSGQALAQQEIGRAHV